MPPPLPLDPHSIARLEGLELRARTIAGGLFAGRHRSHHRGQSVEFAEHRQYVTGDDLRYVDWKAFGKSDRLYLKQFEAESNLYCYLAVDASESMAYRSAGAAMSKLQYAACLAATLAHLAIGQGDSAGLALMATSVRQFVASSNNPAQLDNLVHVLELAEPHGKSDLAASVAELVQRLPRRSIVVLISDLLNAGNGLAGSLRRLRHARHEAIVLHVLDPAEIEFPFDRTTLFRGLESMPDILAEPHGVRAAYLAACDRFLEQAEADCRTCQADYQLARTDDSLDAPLRHLLTSRLRRWR
ncbi:MAG: DUF58 domain-containing protein [Planctomycetota bacterium]|nr:MAG: DUF58 domain-containing protein [Planctomycetota bacterium]